MSQENVEIVREYFEAYRRGDHAAAAAYLASDVAYKMTAFATAHGPDEVRAAWERWANPWDEVETIPEEFIDAGNHVVVAVRCVIDVSETHTYEVHTLRDGKIVRMDEFTERSKALEAAGLQE